MECQKKERKESRRNIGSKNGWYVSKISDRHQNADAESPDSTKGKYRKEKEEIIHIPSHIIFRLLTMKDKETAQEAREGISPALSKEYRGGKVVFCLPMLGLLVGSL